MGQGIIIASKATLTLSTADSANQINPTYDYLSPGVVKLYARGSDATVLANLFVGGTQICNRTPVPFFGTTGGLSTADHLMTQGATRGGRVILTFAASAGTPTVDYQATFEGLALGNVLSVLGSILR